MILQIKQVKIDFMNIPLFWNYFDILVFQRAKYRIEIEIAVIIFLNFELLFLSE